MVNALRVYDKATVLDGSKAMVKTVVIGVVMQVEGTAGAKVAEVVWSRERVQGARGGAKGRKGLEWSWVRLKRGSGARSGGIGQAVHGRCCWKPVISQRWW